MNATLIDRLVDKIYGWVNGIPKPTSPTPPVGAHALIPIRDVKSFDQNSSLACKVFALSIWAAHGLIPYLLAKLLIRIFIPVLLSYPAIAIVTTWGIAALVFTFCFKSYLVEKFTVGTKTGTGRVVKGNVLPTATNIPYGYQDQPIQGQKEYNRPFDFKWPTQSISEDTVATLDLVVVDFPANATEYYTKDGFVIRVTPQLSYRALIGKGRLPAFFLTSKANREKLLQGIVQMFLTQAIGEHTLNEFTDNAFRTGFTSELSQRMKMLFGGEDCLSELELLLGITTTNLIIVDFSLTKKEQAALESRRTSTLIIEVALAFAKARGENVADHQDIQQAERIFNQAAGRKDIIVSGGGGGSRKP